MQSAHAQFSDRLMGRQRGDVSGISIINPFVSTSLESMCWTTAGGRLFRPLSRFEKPTPSNTKSRMRKCFPGSQIGRGPKRAQISRKRRKTINSSSVTKKCPIRLENGRRTKMTRQNEIRTQQGRLHSSKKKKEKKFWADTPGDPRGPSCPPLGPPGASEFPLTPSAVRGRCNSAIL